VDLLVSAYQFGGSEASNTHHYAQDFDDVCHCGCNFQIIFRSQAGRWLEGTPCVNRCFFTLFVYFGRHWAFSIIRETSWLVSLVTYYVKKGDVHAE